MQRISQYVAYSQKLRSRWRDCDAQIGLRLTKERNWCHNCGCLSISSTVKQQI